MDDDRLHVLHYRSGNAYIWDICSYMLDVSGRAILRCAQTRGGLRMLDKNLKSWERTRRDGSGIEFRKSLGCFQVRLAQALLSFFLLWYVP